MVTTTTVYSFQKPDVSGDEDAWGGYLNANIDKYESILTGNTTITSLVITTADINGGTLDNVVIGGATPAAITGTTITGTSLVGPLATAAQPNITSLGTLTTLTVDDITINGSTISDAADLTIDVGGDLIIDVDGADVKFRDGGTEFAHIFKSGNNAAFYNAISDGDLQFVGIDSNLGQTTALTLDMSDAGTAIFNHDIKLGDNSKAFFGASSDLEVYHNGTNSVIYDNGTGNLQLVSGGASVDIIKAGGENMATFATDGAATLYFDNAAKIATSSTGISVTGTVTADLLTVESTGEAAALFKGYTSVTGGNSTINGEILLGNNANFQGRISYEGATQGFLYIENSYNNDAADIVFRSKSSGTAKNNLLIEGNGDISFYEDTGTTAKFFWDASTERLGIGNSAPTTALDVTGTVTADLLNVTSGSSADNIVQVFGGGTIYAGVGVDGTGAILTAGSSGSADAALIIKTSASGTETERMRILADGKIGMGTSTPDEALVVVGDLKVDTGANAGVIHFGDVSDQTKIVGFDSTGTIANTLLFTTGTNERMRITSDGEVGINKSTVPNTSSSAYKSLVIANEEASKSARFVAMGAASAYTSYSSLTSGTHTNFTFYSPSLIYTDTLRFLSAPLNNEPDDTNLTERMRLTTTGLGIGDSAPISTLEISKSDQTNGTTFTITNAFSGGSWAVDDVIGSIDFRSDDASSSELTRGRIQSVTDDVTGTNWSYGTALTFSTAFNNTLSERLRISSDGSVGIGNTNPSDYNSNADNLVVGTTSGHNGITISSGTDSYGSIYFSDGTSGVSQYRGIVQYIHSQDEMRFYTNAAQRMVIDTSGNLLLGKTSTGTTNSGAMDFTVGVGTYLGVLNINHSTTNVDGSGFINFSRDTAYIGSISQNGTTGVSYNTSSDHRLKENVVDLTSATTRLKQLDPKRFNFIADADRTVDGFLAHEVQSVVPEAITGTHNEVDADGNPVYQGIDQSKLVPLLVATIKELEARITALEGV